MIKRIQQLALVLLVLVFAYFATLTATIRWLQIAPNQVVWALQKLSDGQVSFKDLKLEQTWLGVDVEVWDFSLDTPEAHLSSRKLVFDYNFWSPFFYDVSPGELLFFDGLEVQLFTKQNVEKTSELDVLGYLKLFHVRHLWQKIQVKNAILEVSSERALRVEVDDFQSIKGLHWRTLGEFSISWDHQPKIPLQLKSDFVLSFLGHLSEGEFSLHLSQPVLIDSWLHYLPLRWQKALPRGDFLGRLQVRLTSAQELTFSTEFNAQQLVWLENDAVMPKSLGFEFKFKPSLGSEVISLSDWDFELDSLRLDNAFVEAHSPIKLFLKQGSKLAFSSPSLSVKPFLPILSRILKPIGLHIPNLESVQFDVTEVHGTLDLKNIELSQFDFNVTQLNFPEYEYYPAVSAKNLHVSLLDHQLRLDSSSPVSITISGIRAEPFLLHLVQPFEVSRTAKLGTWQVHHQQFLLDTLPVELTASGDDLHNIDLRLSVAASTLAEAKAFIPYPLMGDELQDWLKNGLLSGENIKGNLMFQGSLQDFSFHSDSESLGRLVAELSIDNARLKFQPDWPEVHNFKANLKFTPYKLTISADKAQMLEANLKNVLVDIEGLNQKNIAVNIQAQAQASMPNALILLSQTPLLKKADIESFVSQQLITGGDVYVDFSKIWIPVYGYDKRKEEIQGKATLVKNNILLFDKLLIKQLQGDVFFTEKSVQAKKITGVLANGVVNGVISTPSEGQALLQLSGELQSQQLLSEMFGIKGFVSGDVPWTLDVSLPLKSGLGVSITSLSSLSKVKSELPKPFNTEFFEKQGQNLKAQFTMDKHLLNMQVQLTNWGSAQVLWDIDNSEVFGFKASLGKKQTIENISASKGQYELISVFDEVNLDEWINWSQKGTSKSSVLPDWLGQKSSVNSEVLIDNLKLDDANSYKKVALRWQYLSQTKDLLAEFTSQQGHLYIKKDLLSNYSVSAKGFIYNLMSSAPSLKQDCKPWSGFEVNSLNFKGNQLMVNGKSIDELSFKYEDTEEQQLITKIHLKSTGLGGDVSGSYQIDKKTQLSALNFELNSTDIAHLSRFLEIKQGFTGRKGWATGDLKWAGSIDCFDLEKLNGFVEFRVEDGVIENAEPGIARLLGLLSIESLARRLKLDIKDVTNAGLAYDRISGKGHFENGILSLRDFKLSAPSADAELFGRVNLVNRKVKLDVRVTPAIGTTLPIVAAVSGVATPVAGVLAYALMKAIPAINEDLVTYRYEVEGIIEEPKIKDKGLALELLNNEKRQVENENILE